MQTSLSKTVANLRSQLERKKGGCVCINYTIYLIRYDMKNKDLQLKKQMGCGHAVSTRHHTQLLRGSSYQKKSDENLLR